MKLTSALATILAATVCTSTAVAQRSSLASYRSVQSITVSTDEVTKPSLYSSSTLRVKMKVKDEVNGVGEDWEMTQTTHRYNGSSVSSLDINGSPRYIIKQAYIGGEVFVSVQTEDGSDWASLNDYNSRPFFAYLIESVVNERMFVVEVMNDLRTTGTVQGLAVTFDVAGAYVTGFPTNDNSGLAAANCRDQAEALYGPKPEDCEGAIDEYLCCIWEYLVDGAESACECDKLPWYKEVPCYAAITVASGVDGLACVAGLPIPGA